MTDAIHNFHPQYQQYTQYSSNNKTKVGLWLPVKGFRVYFNAWKK